MRGYTKTEVDAYIALLTNRYAELYKNYEALSRKQADTEAALAAANAELAEKRENEDAIRRALINSQNAAARIVENAKQKGEELEKLSREKCGEVIAEFREHIREERERLNALRAQVTSFKSRLFGQYQEHIGLIEKLTEGLEEGDWDLTPADATRSVLALLRGEIDRRTRNDEREEEKLDSEIDAVIDRIAHNTEDTESREDGTQTDQ